MGQLPQLNILKFGGKLPKLHIDHQRGPVSTDSNRLTLLVGRENT